MKKLVTLILILCSVTSFAKNSEKSEKEEDKDAVTKCLEAWGTHPFGANPKYKTMATSVKVFGIGNNPKDTAKTNEPVLTLINPGVNVMGGTTYELLNPNGWYCFRANVNVMGGLTIKAHCKAHIASANDGATVLASSETDSDKSVTVMGSTKVEKVGCN
jgi:hypothetical protein